MFSVAATDNAIWIFISFPKTASSIHHKWAAVICIWWQKPPSTY